MLKKSFPIDTVLFDLDLCLTSKIKRKQFNHLRIEAQGKKKNMRKPGKQSKFNVNQKQAFFKTFFHIYLTSWQFAFLWSIHEQDGLLIFISDFSTFCQINLWLLKREISIKCWSSWIKIVPDSSRYMYMY